MYKLPTRVPYRCQKGATLNYDYDVLNLSCQNLLRFFCLSLYRDAKYYVKVTYKDLAYLTGEKEGTVSAFGKVCEEFMNKQLYRDGDKDSLFRPLRNIHYIPPIRPPFINITANFILIDLAAVHKGYLLKLILISKFAGNELTVKSIVKGLGMGVRTVRNYNLELVRVGLAEYVDKDRIVLKVDEILLPNEDAEQKLLSTDDIGENDPPNITWNSQKVW